MSWQDSGFTPQNILRKDWNFRNSYWLNKEEFYEKDVLKVEINYEVDQSSVTSEREKF